MSNALTAIQDEVRQLKLDQSLLALNHILSVSRGVSRNPSLERLIKSVQFRPPAYLIHFLAKQLLIHGSNLGYRTLDWSTYVRLTELCISLDDPIQHDPEWKHADPSGFFERILSQQIPSQRRNLIQKYGLALGLFRDVETVDWPKHYDLRSEIEKEIRCPIEQFMATAHVCMALRQASWQGQRCPGTFTPLFFAEAFSQGVKCCIPENWNPFLERVACDRDRFRSICDSKIYRVTDALYTPFEFNPLVRYPIIEVAPGHFVAVDPDLIVERATFGLFYDLFERDRTSFTIQFGHVFDKFVGKLLRTVCAPESLWSASEWERNANGRERARHGKIGDWVYSGRSAVVLFECKSMRPSLALSTYGSDESIAAVVKRVAEALEQLIEHGRSIQAGEWKQCGLLPGRTLCVVVTYGRLHTVNGPFVRQRIVQTLKSKGFEAPSFVVVSLEELDSIIRLVEVGNGLDEVVNVLAQKDGSFDVLRDYYDVLSKMASSSSVFETGRAFVDQFLIRRNSATEQQLVQADNL